MAINLVVSFMEWLIYQESFLSYKGLLMPLGLIEKITLSIQSLVYTEVEIKRNGSSNTIAHYSFYNETNSG